MIAASYVGCYNPEQGNSVYRFITHEMTAAKGDHRILKKHLHTWDTVKIRRISKVNSGLGLEHALFATDNTVIKTQYIYDCMHGCTQFILLSCCTDVL